MKSEGKKRELGSYYQQTNKAFKADSQRVAFLVLVGFSVYDGMVKFSGSVAHYLTRRYNVWRDNVTLGKSHH